MIAHSRLQPDNATPFELLMSDVNDPLAALGDLYDGIRTADINTPTPFMPWLIWQYGLGELTPYFTDQNALISQGIAWQRVRGTPASVYLGLGWVGYAGTIEEAPTRRRRWNLFQVALSTVRAADYPDLIQIDGIVSLSPPARSKFYRAFSGYDFRACETSYQKSSQSLWGDDSGVAIAGSSVKWSFGRRYEFDHTCSQAELTALGTWIAPAPTDDRWVNMAFEWANTGYQWATIDLPQSRRNAIAGAILVKQAYLRLRAADGSIIGHTRAVSRPVSLQNPGCYTLGGNQWGINAPAPTAVYVQGATRFGDGQGLNAASVSLVLGGAIAPAPDNSARPGAPWLGPAELTGGAEIATSALNITFGQTVREQIAYLLRF